jgi:thiamine biosynthesis lipoprotein
MSERERSVQVFGGTVLLRAAGHTGGLDAPAALVLAAALLRDVHDRLTLFESTSELSRLNDDPREEVPVSPLVARLAAAVRPAGLLSGGLVDATARAGGACGGWADVRLGAGGTSVVRPPGTRIDSGGLAKGMAADLLAHRFAGFDSFLVECLGDLRTGGTAGLTRPVEVAGPSPGDSVLDVHALTGGAVATSGTTRRAGHLLDPRTGAPADTGVLQATALAPTALEAEVRAKAALLAGPRDAAHHLPFGGTLVQADGTVVRLPARGLGTATPARALVAA